jgi:ABC-type branched-subunit amino acid transport system ATPase component/branched-subunit amino acid ABC-type transport system permease component
MLMSNFLIFVILGIAPGAVYALAGIGLVLTYKTSGVFNFAQGALATVAAYLFYTLMVQHGWPWPLAAFVATFGLGTVMGLLLAPLARVLSQVSLARQVASTIGLYLAIEAIIVLIYGTSQLRQVPPFGPHGQFVIDGAPITWQSVMTLGVAVVATGGLYWWLRQSRRGIAMRAVVDDDQLLSLAGTNPAATRRAAWIIGSTFACASGVLFAPLFALDPVQLTLLVVSAFGAAAIGRFTSLPLTFAGGIGLGVLSALATGYLTIPSLTGVAPSLPFIVLFVVILIMPKRGFRDRITRGERRGNSWTAPLMLQIVTGVAIVAFLLFVPSFAGIHLTAWTAAVAAVIMFLSLSLLVRTSGQVSLCQVSFAAIGAAAFSHLEIGLGLPWLVALLVSGLIVVPIGALLAIPAIRVGGLFLALGTFGLGILIQYMFYTQSYMFGTIGVGLAMPRPKFLGVSFQSDKAFFYLVVALTVIVAVGITALSRARLGRLLQGIGDSPIAIETTGASITITRTVVFCISVYLAAISGALTGMATFTVSGASYPPLLSLTYFAVITIVVGREPWNAVLAAFPLVLIPSYVSSSEASTVLQLVFGVSALLIVFAPSSAQGVPARLAQAVDAIFRRRPAGPVPAAVPTERTAPKVLGTATSGLELNEVSVYFGGVHALKSVQINAPLKQITGIIGPNGAGKTTLFNVVSGLVRPRHGQVRFDGRNMAHVRPAPRARMGVGRTFQQMRLFDSLTVRQNVALGREGRYAGSNPFAHIAGRRHTARDVELATNEALRLCALTELADTPVAALPTGQRRMVDLARCLAGSYQLLLLDEPSSGLDRAETQRLSAVIRRVVAERDVGVILVEHDLSLVLDLCSTIYVLDFGNLIFEGTPTDVTQSSLVQQVYLGTVDEKSDSVLAVADEEESVS